MTLETGLAIRESRLEVERTVEIFTFAADEARRFSALGELVPIDGVPARRGTHRPDAPLPLGAVLGITAFNAPLLLVAHKIAPALAVGCPCILRPAPKTPLSALSLGEIMVEAGAPPAALSVIPSSNELAERMVRDSRVKMLTFTGSARVGWHLKSVAATPRVTLELGGNGAVVVHEDAVFDYAATRCAFGGSYEPVRPVYPSSVSTSTSLSSSPSAGDPISPVSRTRTGDPREDETTLAGLIDDAAAEKTMGLIEEARAAGATVLHGGRTGSVIEPTLLADVSEELRVCAEEAFAPVVVLLRYRDLENVFERVNASPYGLQAGLFTHDIRVVNRAFETLDVGALIVNDINSFRVDQMPYGGVKQSGHGREGIRSSMREMSEEKLLVIDPR